MSKFRKNKGLSQEKFGKKLGLSQATYQTYESGRTEIPPNIQSKIKELGFAHPFPQDEVNPITTSNGPVITPEDFYDLKAAVKAHVEYWRAGEERVLEKMMELARRISELEKRV